MTSCVRCGHELGIGRFCLNCGHPVGEPVPAQPAATPGGTSAPEPAGAATPPWVPWVIGLSVLLVLLGVLAVLAAWLGNDDGPAEGAATSSQTSTAHALAVGPTADGVPSGHPRGISMGEMALRSRPPAPFRPWITRSGAGGDSQEPPTAGRRIGAGTETAAAA